MKNPDVFLTSIGSFLRKFSLDELQHILKKLGASDRRQRSEVGGRESGKDRDIRQG